MARSLMRKFREVKKKDGVPVKYTAGAANPEARRAEIRAKTVSNVYSRKQSMGRFTCDGRADTQKKTEREI